MITYADMTTAEITVDVFINENKYFSFIINLIREHKRFMFNIMNTVVIILEILMLSR